MSALYAVTDPSTGEVVKEYPTATGEQIEAAIAAYAKDVRSRAFPGPDQVYGMRPKAPKRVVGS